MARGGCFRALAQLVFEQGEDDQGASVAAASAEQQLADLKQEAEAAAEAGNGELAPPPGPACGSAAAPGRPTG